MVLPTLQITLNHPLYFGRYEAPDSFVLVIFPIILYYLDMEKELKTMENTLARIVKAGPVDELAYRIY